MCSNLCVSYFVILIFVFWSWVMKISKIWTSQKFGTTARIAKFYISTNFIAWTVTLNDQKKITGQQLLVF